MLEGLQGENGSKTEGMAILHMGKAWGLRVNNAACSAFLVMDQFLCWVFVLTMKSRDAQTAQFPVLQLQLQAKKNTY